MRLELFDHPLVFWVVILALVLSLQWLFYMGSNAMGWKNLSKFLAGPPAA